MLIPLEFEVVLKTGAVALHSGLYPDHYLDLPCLAGRRVVLAGCKEFGVDRSLKG